MRSLVPLALLSLLAAACSGAGSIVGGDEALDAASEGLDAALLDAGSASDSGSVLSDASEGLDAGAAGLDAGPAGLDADLPPDADGAGLDAGAADAASGTDAAAPCPADTLYVPPFCMDRYEAPNIPGAPPLAMQTAYDGETFCQARGKRVCTEAEWVRACQGPAALPYPYGSTYKKGTCNDDKTWLSPDWTTLGSWPSAAAKAEAARLYQADPSGQRTGCVSAEGVQDLTGNVAEWVKRSFDHATNYDYVMKGCYWAGCYGGSPPSCAFVNPAHPGGFRTYEAGFRCCQDAR